VRTNAAQNKRVREIAVQIVGGGHDRECAAKYYRAAFVAETIGVRHPVAKTRAERLREKDRHPVEELDPRRGDGIDQR
jgi:hypothetical protein